LAISASRGAARPPTLTPLACGWSNPSAFIETFRRAFGATPGKFYADAGSAV
jgi:methylphosphotriester-DNA--protein-cysteine methyltransferase